MISILDRILLSNSEDQAKLLLSSANTLNFIQTYAMGVESWLNFIESVEHVFSVMNMGNGSHNITESVWHWRKPGDPQNRAVTDYRYFTNYAPFMSPMDAFNENIMVPYWISLPFPFSYVPQQETICSDVISR